MTLRHFHIFITVCDERNMTKASKKLFMSQSAVSQAIAELEKKYNVRLFERLSRKLYLTEAGEKLLGYARHMVGMNKDLEEQMKALTEKNRIRIGASVTVGAWILPLLIETYTKERKEVLIEVIENNTTEIESLLLNDKLDIGLVEGEMKEKDLVSKAFIEDPLVLICGQGHPFSKKIIVEPKELEKENFILREQGSGTRRTFERVMQQNKIKWESSWTCNNVDTIKNAVEKGFGISVLSKRAVEKEIEEGKLYTVAMNGIFFTREIRFIYHKNKYLTEGMKEFISFCFNLYAQS